MLGPVARHKGWAPGPIGDWKNGATGWVLWISLAIMLGDSLTSLSLLLITSLQRHITAIRPAFNSLLLLLFSLFCFWATFQSFSLLLVLPCCRHTLLLFFQPQHLQHLASFDELVVAAGHVSQTCVVNKCGCWICHCLSWEGL